MNAPPEILQYVWPLFWFGLAAIVVLAFGLWRAGALSLSYREPERPKYFDSHQHPD